MNILEQLQKDIEDTLMVQEELLTLIEKHIELSSNVDRFIADHLDSASRTSTEKQIIALRAENDSFNEDYLEMEMIKHKIDLLKNKLSILSTRQRIADTMNRYKSSNLIEG